MTGTRSFWGWGLEGAGPSPDHQQGLLRTMAARLEAPDLELRPEPRVEDLALRPPRVAPPAALASICSADPRDRALHHYGRSYRDVVRGARGEFPHPPDQIARPADEAGVAAVLDWCSEAGIACSPYGGGSSVVGGFEVADSAGFEGHVVLDLGRLDRVLEIDRVSRAARIQAGVFGPALEDQLRPHGLTLRHFPQSFEFSTLGGWIATRSGGHYASLYTHIDDFVENLRAITPAGAFESRRLPGSGAGPSPDRLWLGSEGTLGVITEAWMRLQDRPTFRESMSVRFSGAEGFLRGAEAVRALSQSGLFPSNCRLLDANEAANTGAGDGASAVLVLGFESADHDPAAKMARALECCRDAGGAFDQRPKEAPKDPAAQRKGAAGAWRNAFLQAPYLRDVLARMAIVCETFETAISWDRFPAFHARVMRDVGEAVRRECGSGWLTCRFTHVYPDGPAPYYSVTARGRRGDELAQWAAIKAAANEAIIEGGGTITHHHAVGRDHRPGYDRQRPELFARGLRALKREFDPQGVLNPGVLYDPEI